MDGPKKNLTLWGSVSAAVISVILRLLIGEEMIGLPPLIPMEKMSLLFPIKTLLMLLSMLTLYSVSKLTKTLPNCSKHRLELNN